ncbi:MAG: TauD/TfdA family dioxygenase [Alphaproteobacteria bacterium]|nr:TauD/TfdA family dioxygenase [Alphaproteobacteria bacterium]
MSPPRPPRLIEDGAALQVDLAEGAARFHALWLRDNDPGPKTRDPGSGQKRIGVCDLDLETRIVAAAWEEDRLQVRFAPGDFTSVFEAGWLAAHAYDRVRPRTPGWTPSHLKLWEAKDAENLPVETFTRLRQDETRRLAWLDQIRRYGFARLSGAPLADGAALEVATLVGFVRETNYGRSFDVRVEVAARNLADTALGLEAHTDNPYRDPPPGVQILVCLANAVTGGGSILVDGFAAAQALRAEDPDAFGRLARYPARFEYAGTPGVRLQAKAPMIALGADGELLGLRINNRSTAALTDIPYDEMAAYYAAWRRFAELIATPRFRLGFRLEPGEAMVFDNLRILHAREAFTGAGARWLQGCYVDRDGLYSALAAARGERAWAT